MPDFGIFRGFNEKLFGDKLYAGQLPTQLGIIGSQEVGDLLLDAYPNAAAAYSLRKLRAAYTGSAIEVRRTNLDVADIGFTSTGELDTAALLDFTGTGASDAGFVTKWYDQSGNSNNATQATAANQPQIVSSGSVILENLKPTISFLSGLSGLDFSTFSASSVTMFMTVKAKNDPPISQNSGFVKFGTDSLNNHYPFTDSNIYDDSFSSTRKSVGNPITALNQLNLYNVASTNTQWTAWLNTNQIFTTGINTVQINTNPKIGSKGVLFGMNNFISELIIYPSDQSSNRTGIEININDFYSIY
jgi:hypothetical protein